MAPMTAEPKDAAKAQPKDAEWAASNQVLAAAMVGWWVAA